MTQEWMPIETAPKDGSEILCYQKDGWGVYAAVWNSRLSAWYTGFEPAIIGAGFTYEISPTHWMPLPPPPKD